MAKVFRTAVYCSCSKRDRVPEALDDPMDVVRQLEPKRYRQCINEAEGICTPSITSRVTRNSTVVTDPPNSPPTPRVDDDPRENVRRVFLTDQEFTEYHPQRRHDRVRVKRGVSKRSSRVHTKEDDWESKDYITALQWIILHPTALLGEKTYSKMKRQKNIFDGVSPTAVRQRMYRTVFPDLLAGKPWGLNAQEFETLKRLISHKFPKLAENNFQNEDES